MHTSRARLVVTVATLLTTSLLPTSRGETCGAMLFDQHESRPGGMSDQEIFIGAMRNETLMVVSAGYAGSDTRDFAFLLPIPAEPEQVEDGARALFQVLEHGTGPRVFIETPSSGGGDGGGCGCGSSDKAGGLGDGARSADIDVRDRGETETWEYVVVGGGGNASVAEWLNAEGFTAPASMADAIDGYVADGWLFFAAKVKPGAGDGVLAPLQMHFPRVEPESLVVPIGISAESLAPEGSLGITLYLWSSESLVPKNYGVVNASTFSLQALSPSESDYETVFEAAASQGEGQLVIEYADSFGPGSFDLWHDAAVNDGATLDGDPAAFRDAIATMVDGSETGRLIRLRTRLRPDQLQDVTIEVGDVPTTSNEHFLYYEGGASEAGLVAGGLLALLSLLVVRQRRRSL